MKIHALKLFLLALFSLSLVACGGSDDPGSTKIDTAIIPGVTAPTFGGAPVTSINETSQYTGTVTWSPAVSGTFAAETVYVATITLKPKTGFTLQGVAANFFTVAGATATNAANAGVVTAAFPATEAEPGSAWEIPGYYDLNIGVYFGETRLGEICVDTLTSVKQVILTSETGRVMPSYLLTAVLEAAGISIPADYATVAAQRNTVVDPSNDVTVIADITKAYLVLARIDPGNETTENYPRIIADGTISITTSAIRQGFDQLVFTPEGGNEPAWEIPLSYNSNIEVFNGTTLIGAMDFTRASLTGLKQVIFETTSAPPRVVVAYLLTDVLKAAGIGIPAVYTSLTGQPAAAAPNPSDVTEIPSIAKAYVVVARIDEATPALYDPPRIIADGTVAFGNNAIRSGFERLVFTQVDENEPAWEIPLSYNSSIEVFNGAASIGTIDFTRASLAGLEQVIFETTSAPPRVVVAYLLTDVLKAAGIGIPAVYTTLTGQPFAADPNPNDVTAIDDITKAYVVVARIDEATPTLYDPPRIIADGTVAFGNNVIRSGFERLVFTP